jgi:hypothetical protein
LYATGFRDPRFLLSAPNSDIFVVESRTNQIKVLCDTKGDGRPDLSETFAEKGLKQTVRDRFLFTRRRTRSFCTSRIPME